MNFYDLLKLSQNKKVLICFQYIETCGLNIYKIGLYHGYGYIASSKLWTMNTQLNMAKPARETFI